MSRAALVLMVVIGAGGCGEGGDGRARITDPCLRFTSCGSCTPVRGCGWCTHEGDGGVDGLCLSDPLSCPGPKFTWTWEPLACTDGDGGAPALDGGASDR